MWPIVTLIVPPFQDPFHIQCLQRSDPIKKRDRNLQLHWKSYPIDKPTRCLGPSLVGLAATARHDTTHRRNLLNMSCLG
jgi:hypothetical protein